MLKYRVIPFNDLNTGEQLYTLVTEWWAEGRLVKDSRQQMDAECFDTLAQAVDDARNEVKKNLEDYCTNPENLKLQGWGG